MSLPSVIWCKRSSTSPIEACSLCTTMQCLMGNHDLVTVVITTRNSIRTIERCVDSIRLQDVTAIEVIVVDNHSDDGTVEAVRDKVDRLIVAGPERCAQRNVGIWQASGLYTLIVDSDMVLNANVVRMALSAINMSGAAAVVIPEQSFGTGFWARCKQRERSFYHSDRRTTAARFFRTAALRELGGYDEYLVSGEDWDLSIRATESPAFADAVIQHDEGHLRLTSLASKKFYYGKFLPRFIAKHGRKALIRLNPARPSLLINVHVLSRTPRLFAGLLIMKATEAAAGIAGMVIGVAPLIRRTAHSPPKF